MPVKTKKKEKTSKKADLDYFDKLFRGIWAQMVPVVGVTSLHSLLSQALVEASANYRILEHTRVREGSVSLTEFKGLVKDKSVSLKEIQEALWAFLEVFTQTVSKLSGEAVSKQIITYIESQDRGRGKTFSELLYRTGLKF